MPSRWGERLQEVHLWVSSHPAARVRVCIRSVPDRKSAVLGHAPSAFITCRCREGPPRVWHGGGTPYEPAPRASIASKSHHRPCRPSPGERVHGGRGDHDRRPADRSESDDSIVGRPSDAHRCLGGRLTRVSLSSHGSRSKRLSLRTRAEPRRRPGVPAEAELRPPRWLKRPVAVHPTDARMPGPASNCGAGAPGACVHVRFGSSTRLLYGSFL